MKKTVVALSVMFLFLLGCNAKHAVETKDASEFVAALSDASSQIRADAAASLRRLLTADPSARTNDHGEDYWKQRVASVRPGMKHSEVVELLPAYDQTLSAERLLGSGMGTGNSHFATWRLDHYWIVTILYRNPDRVIKRPKLENRAMRIWVKPPEDFTGTWVTWYVNGCKSHEIEYKDGKYHGTFIAFYDNEQRCYQQHYSNGVCSGVDSGWYRDGSKSYQGTYANGKQEGVWTHWYPDGGLRARSGHRDGKLHGTWSTWREDGKEGVEISYRNGKKHGPDKAWDKSGKLLWSRHFKNGELIRSDPVEETASQPFAPVQK